MEAMLVLPQFELEFDQRVIPKSPRFYQRAEGSPMAHSVAADNPASEKRLRSIPRHR